MSVYFDNAATTRLDPQVLDCMIPYMLENYGNASSVHGFGRAARFAVENARTQIANYLQASPGEIFFTSGGTESDNTAILSAVKGMGIRRVITSSLEHHAILHTLQALERSGAIQLLLVRHDRQGVLDLSHLEELLQSQEKAFVSIMHGNNEIGNLNDIETIATLCRHYQAIFHTDTVQTMGHYRFDLSRLPVHFLVGSAHKFHGPKGVGFLYVRKSVQAHPLISGGSQEKGVRAGTENVSGIAGMAKALEIAYAGLDHHRHAVENLKRLCIQSLRSFIPDISFNGCSASLDKSLYTVLSTNFPDADADLLSYLDQRGFAVSGGSACNSHSKGSHVIRALQNGQQGQVVRFSFSRYNTLQEVRTLAAELSPLYKQVAVA
ncbi:MAG: cysteine desulfurase [Williamsia sp.]|nr:cysteine desulfurase [Williamsia sp.]